MVCTRTSLTTSLREASLRRWRTLVTVAFAQATSQPQDNDLQTSELHGCKDAWLNTSKLGGYRIVLPNEVQNPARAPGPRAGRHRHNRQASDPHASTSRRWSRRGPAAAGRHLNLQENSHLARFCGRRLRLVASSSSTYQGLPPTTRIRFPLPHLAHNGHQGLNFSSGLTTRPQACGSLPRSQPCLSSVTSSCSSRSGTIKMAACTMTRLACSTTWLPSRHPVT